MREESSSCRKAPFEAEKRREEEGGGSSTGGVEGVKRRGVLEAGVERKANSRLGDSSSLSCSSVSGLRGLAG